MLIKVLYKYCKNNNLEFDPTLFQQIVKALIPDNRSIYNKIEAL